MRVISLATALVLAAPALAFGEETEIELQANGETGRAEDANIDRGFLLSTAETQPQGSLTISNYDLFMTGATYGVTDEIQIGGLILTPLFEEGHDDWFGVLSGKAKLVSRGRFRLAAQATAGRMVRPLEDPGTVYLVGGIGTICLDDACRSLVSTNLSWLGLSAHDIFSSPEEQNIILGLSWVQSILPNAKLLVEVIGVANKDATGWEIQDEALVNYGFRATSGQVSGEFGFLKSIRDDGELPLGIPFFSFTYRML